MVDIACKLFVFCVAGLKGLPKKWEVALKASGISAEQAKKNPDETMDVLKFHFEGLPKVPQLPSRQTLKKNLKGALNIVEKNPFKFYQQEKKLGEGAVSLFLLLLRRRHVKSSSPL